MIGRIKRLLSRAFRAGARPRPARPVEHEAGEVSRHLDSLIREMTRLHMRMEILEELIRQTHAADGAAGGDSAEDLAPPFAAALRKRVS